MITSMSATISQILYSIASIAIVGLFLYRLFGRPILIVWQRSQARKELTDTEKTLIQKLSFDESAAQLFKRRYGRPLKQLTIQRGTETPKRVRGLSIEVERAIILTKAIRQFQALGYQLFQSRRGYRFMKDGKVADTKLSAVSLIQSNDPYDILRIEQTDGVNYGLSTHKIIEQLKAWAKQSTFMIDGAGPDRVELRFETLPNDMLTFAKEVFAFCPDIPGITEMSEAEFAEDVRKGRGIVFWWD